MPTIRARFPTCETPEIDYDSIMDVQEQEDRHNSKEQEACERLDAGCDYEQKHNPVKDIFNPLKFK